MPLLAVVRSALEFNDLRGGPLGLRLGHRQRHHRFARIQQAVFPGDRITIASNDAYVFDLRFEPVQLVDDLDTLHFRQTEEVLFMIMESERKLRSNIRGAARRVGFLEPKQDLVPNEELHRLIAIDHVDSIVAHQRGLSPVDYLFPDEVGATAFASPYANEAACQPIVPCVKDG